MKELEFEKLKTTIFGNEFTEKQFKLLEVLLQHKQNLVLGSKASKVLNNDPGLVVLFNHISIKSGNPNMSLHSLMMRSPKTVTKGKSVLKQIEVQAIAFVGHKTLSRTERLRAPVLFVRYACQHLSRAKAPLTPNSILNQVNNFGAFLDNNFPGYRKTPMAKMVLGKLFEE